MSVTQVAEAPTMRAVVIDGQGNGWVADLPRPTLGPYDCLVRVRSCGFCNGTDLKLWHIHPSRWNKAAGWIVRSPKALTGEHSAADLQAPWSASRVRASRRWPGSRSG